jgi:hypothetical protein
MGKLSDILNKIYSWCNFQGRYDAIEKWDVSPETKMLINQIWLTLPVAIQSSIWSMIKKLAEQYGDEFAEAILNGVLNALKKV